MKEGTYKQLRILLVVIAMASRQVVAEDPKWKTVCLKENLCTVEQMNIYEAELKKILTDIKSSQGFNEFSGYEQYQMWQELPNLNYKQFYIY